MQWLAVLLVSMCALAGVSTVPTPRARPASDVVWRDDAALRRVLQQEFSVRSLPCSCEGVTCACCAGINIQQIKFNQQGCVNFSYDASNLAVAMNVLANNRTLYETRISGRNPPPFCVPVPQFPAVMFCARFYDIHQDGGNVVACVKLEVFAFSVTVIVINFDCIKIGIDGVSIVKPSAQLHVERPLVDTKPKPPTEVVIVLHPTASTAVAVPTYDIAISLAPVEETPPPSGELEAAGAEVDDLDAVEEDLKRVTTTGAPDEEEDYDEEDDEEVAPVSVSAPALVETVVKVQRIVGDYQNYSTRLGENL